MGDVASEVIEKRIDEMFRDVKDITEPSSIDKVSVLLDEIRIADEDYMELLVLKLQGETITWKRPWYQHSSCLTRKIVKNDDAHEEFESGPFTTDEIQTFQKNWRKFVKKFDVPDTPIKLARWKNKEKSKNIKNNPREFVRFYITAYLARGLKRCLYQVNRHFMQSYAYPAKSRYYTTTEEKVMEICFYHKQKNAVSILSTLLGREPRGIYNKLKQYYNGVPERKRVKWTLELATEFLNLLMLHSGCSLKGLKNKQFDQAVWQKVAEDMNHQQKYLQAFWYGKLHVQLFVKCKIKKKPLWKIICHILQESSYKMWTDIRWQEVTQALPKGFTSLFIQNNARVLFAKHPNYLTRPLSEVLDYITTLNLKTGKRLKCVELNSEGNLLYVNHMVKLQDLIKM